MRVDVTRLGDVLIRIKKQDLLDLRDNIKEYPELICPIKEQNTALKRFAAAVMKTAKTIDPPPKKK